MPKSGPGGDAVQDLRNGHQYIGLDALLGRAGAIVFMIVEYEGALIQSGIFLHIQKYSFSAAKLCEFISNER